jgi:predicted DNA-binding transcriptional regulator AlpA
LIFRAITRGDEIMTQLLDYADLKDRGIKYSKAQLWRLWNADKFPKPVKLSAVRNAWRADEIDAWIEQRIAERDRALA